MLYRNVDFFAVMFIGLGLFAFSKLPALELPRVPQTVHVQRALASDQCPISAEVLSQISSLFER